MVEIDSLKSQVPLKKAMNAPRFKCLDRCEVTRELASKIKQA